MEKAIHKLGLTEGIGVATPGVRDEADVSSTELLERRRYVPPRLETHQSPTEAEEEDGWLPPTGTELTRYQSLTASLNYFALDRLDPMLAVEELMRKLSKPSEDDWQFPWRPLSDTLTVYTDTDHAGCLRTRKSTSGGVLVWGKALLKAWSRTQTLSVIFLRRVRNCRCHQGCRRSLKVFKLPGKEIPAT